MIRRAKNKEEEIGAIYNLINDAAIKGSILARSHDEIGEVINGFYVAVEDERIVGCCAIEVYNRKLAEIRSLVVVSEYRGRGIAKRLVEACLEDAREKGVMEVITITDKDAFFEKTGFKKVLNGQWAMFVKFE